VTPWSRPAAGAEGWLSGLVAEDQRAARGGQGTEDAQERSPPCAGSALPSLFFSRRPRLLDRAIARLRLPAEERDVLEEALSSLLGPDERYRLDGVPLSVRMLEARLRYGKSTMQRALAALLDRGVLVRRPDPDRRKPHRYQVTHPAWWPGISALRDELHRCLPPDVVQGWPRPLLRFSPRKNNPQVIHKVRRGVPGSGDARARASAGKGRKRNWNPRQVDPARFWVHRGGQDYHLHEAAREVLDVRFPQWESVHLESWKDVPSKVVLEIEQTIKAAFDGPHASWPTDRFRMAIFAAWEMRHKHRQDTELREQRQREHHEEERRRQASQLLQEWPGLQRASLQAGLDVGDAEAAVARVEAGELAEVEIAHWLVLHAQEALELHRQEEAARRYAEQTLERAAAREHEQEHLQGRVLLQSHPPTGQSASADRPVVARQPSWRVRADSGQAAVPPPQDSESLRATAEQLLELLQPFEEIFWMVQDQALQNTLPTVLRLLRRALEQPALLPRTVKAAERLRQRLHAVAGLSANLELFTRPQRDPPAELPPGDINGTPEAARSVAMRKPPAALRVVSSIAERYDLVVTTPGPTLVDLSPVGELVADLTERSTPGQPVWIAGSPGTGRNWLPLYLAEQAGAVPVWAPSLDELDSAVQLVLQAASALAPETRARVARQAHTPSAAQQVADELAREGRVLAVRLPGNWADEAARPNDVWRAHTHQQGRAVLREFVHHRALRLVLITARTAIPRALGLEPRRPDRVLEAPQVAQSALRDAELWGALAPAAASLVDLPEVERVEAVSVRLAVSLLHLGVSREQVLRELACRSFARRMQGLGSLLRDVLTREAGLRAGLVRLCAFRVPVPRSHLEPIAALAGEFKEVLTRGVAYGEDSVRVHPTLRRFVPGAEDPSEDTRAELMGISEVLDGAVQHWQTDAVRWWLEKHYQAALAGDAGARVFEQAQDTLPAPVWFWTRARALSLARKFEEAATLYERGLDRFPEAAYGWHYLGYNLAKAGQEPRRAEQAFRKAVELEPENPWWNRRLVTFDIGRARFAQAEQDWDEALGRLDPDGERSENDAWLVNQVHCHVAKAWLDVGEPQRAREVLDSIAPGLIPLDWRLEALDLAIDDALESEWLGTSVYHPKVPMAERWRGPRLADPEGVERWFPGRVVAADAEEVQVVYAVPTDPHEMRRVVRARFTQDQWRTLAGGEQGELQPDTFIELLHLSNGSQRVVLGKCLGEADYDDEISPYLRTWA
jgi:hypothetical protein